MGEQICVEYFPLTHECIFISSEVYSMIFDNVQIVLTALYVASLNGHVEVVKILLQNGAHVDVKKEVSLTFLRSAVQALRLKSQCKYMAYWVWPKLPSFMRAMKY